MSDDELSALEDDLDFCGFTGVPSSRVLRVLQDVFELDSDWKELLAQGFRPPTPDAF